MNISLLGGTFNPPHLGHVWIAQQVLDFGGVDEVWFLPNFRQNPPKPVASAEDRLAMSKLLEIPRARVSTIEYEHNLDGNTINLLPFLPKEHIYSFIIGSDQLSSFHLWPEWEKLLSSMPFLVFPRYGYPSDPLYPGMKVIGSEMLIGTNISSTKIRARVKNGLSIQNLVPDAIASYITKHSLYQR